MKSVNYGHYITSSTAIALLVFSQLGQTSTLTIEDEENGVATAAQIVRALSSQISNTAQSGKPDTQPDVPTLDGLSNDTTFQTAFRGFEIWLKENIRAHIDRTKHIHGSQATLGDTLQVATRGLQAYRDHVMKCERDSGKWDESEHVCRVARQVTLSFRNIEATTARGFRKWLRVNNAVHIAKTKRVHGSGVTLNDRREMARKARPSYENHVSECTDEYGTWDESTHECWIDGRVDFSFRLLSFSTIVD